MPTALSGKSENRHVPAVRRRLPQAWRETVKKMRKRRHKPAGLSKDAIESCIVQELRIFERPKEKYSVNTPKGVRYTVYESRARL